MTTAIKSSLTSLHEALQTLEKSAANMQDNLKAAPKAATSGATDLFSATSNTQNDVDAKALASRLDGAIAKVEKLLREGDTSHG